MARNYANIITAIWRDDDFRALPGGAQRLFLLLVTQANISAAGILPLTIRRWATLAVDTSAQSIIADLNVLRAHRYVVVDDDTEELLVRTFIRWDGGYRNSKRRPVVSDAARAVVSPIVRRALAAEFAKLNVACDDLCTEDETAVDDPSDTASDSTSDRPSDGTSDTTTRSDRVVVKVRTKVPHPSTHDPQPTTRGTGERSTHPRARARDQPPPTDAEPSTTERLIAEYVATCKRAPPSKEAARLASEIHALLADGFDADEIRDGITAWRGRRLGAGALPAVVNELANGTRPGADVAIPNGRASPPRSSTRDRKVQETLALASEYRAEQEDRRR